MAVAWYRLNYDERIDRTPWCQPPPSIPSELVLQRARLSDG